MNFLGDLVKIFRDYAAQLFNEDDEKEKSADDKRILKVGHAGVKAPKLRNFETVNECDNMGYEKMKYISSNMFEQAYLDNYERGVIENKILFEMVLKQDPFKTKSERNSNQILDVLGDVGGFYQAIDLIIFTFGEFFSAKFFIVSIAANLYLRKLPKDENGKDDDNNSNFQSGNKTF